MTRRPYTGPDIVVTYDVDRCVHFAECVRGLPAVFSRDRRPWIEPSAAPGSEIAEVVRRCPSGALRYELASGPPEAAERPTVVEQVPWGPVTVRGDLVVDGEAETRVALCACGRTAHRPHCDMACRREP